MAHCLSNPMENHLPDHNWYNRLSWHLSLAGVDAARYTGHSFRIGAATTAAANGVNDATIQILGRWKSDCYTRYIRTPRH